LFVFVFDSKLAQTNRLKNDKGGETSESGGEAKRDGGEA
jgi:hypothetical protein